MDVSENSGISPPNHPILIGFSIIFTIHFGGFPYFWKHPYQVFNISLAFSLRPSSLKTLLDTVTGMGSCSEIAVEEAVTL